MSNTESNAPFISLGGGFDHEAFKAYIVEAGLTAPNLRLITVGDHNEPVNAFFNGDYTPDRALLESIVAHEHRPEEARFGIGASIDWDVAESGIWADFGTRHGR